MAPMSPTENRKLAVKRAIVVIGVVVFAAVAWSGFKVWSAWNNVDQVEFDVDAARDAFGSTTVAPATTVAPPTTVVSPTTSSTSTTTTIPTLFLDRDRLTTFLVMGTDDSTKRADVILLVLLPPNSSDAIMVSIPRDLYVRNPCSGVKTKINENLAGCEARGVSGPEQLAVAIEDFSGIQIDHFAMFTFPGFRQIIDRVGGVEICVGPFPIRDLNEDFDNFQMRAGCSNVTGEQALSWVRSRKTQQLTDAGWVGMPGVNDLTRNTRQQDMLLTALDEIKGIRSLPELQGLVEDVSNTFTIDNGLGLGDAIALLWDAKAISSEDIYRVSLDVRNSSDEFVGSILLLNLSVKDSVINVYPLAYAFEGWND